MPASHRRPVRHKSHQPRIKITYRQSPLASLLPVVRFLSTASLIFALLFSSWSFFTNPDSAGALEFSQKVVGTAKSAAGVLNEAIGDMNGDGKLDIVTAGSDGVKVYVQKSNGTFSTTTLDEVQAKQVFLSDFDKDGQKDILVTLREGSPSVKLYHNNGGLSFDGSYVGTGRGALAGVGDLDKDGYPDIAYAYSNEGVMVLQYWINDGDSNFTGTTLNSDTGITSLAVGDINSDGYADIVTGGTHGLQRWYRTSSAGFTRADIDDANENRSVIVIGDVGSDDRVDIITGDQSKNNVVYYRNVDNNSWQRNVLTGDADTAGLAIVDLDSDGKTDILATSQDDNLVFWYRNDAGFTKSTVAQNLQSVNGVAAADLNGDGNMDFVAGDLGRGTIYDFQRTVSKPQATAANSIAQATNGTGYITFQTTISDANLLNTKLRVLYSTDGITWYKPWIVNLQVNTGTADLKNSNGYQIGTTNPIDTSSSNVEMVVTWDTKSVLNTGPPIVGDIGTVQIRLIPADSKVVGANTDSNKFRVDNLGPSGDMNLQLGSFTGTSATLNWNAPSDTNDVEYTVAYGVDANGVSDNTTEKWNSSKDSTLSNRETTTTTITGLDQSGPYYFKLFSRDSFGNTSSSSRVSGSSGEVSTTSTPTPTATTSAAPVTSSAPIFSPSPVISFEPIVSPTPIIEIPLPSPTPAANHAPVADAGQNQIVNQHALVILDGASSSDEDRDQLIFSWRQLAGPPVQLVSARTATPSFSGDKENASYIFALTVSDGRGGIATDEVTIATKALPTGPVASVSVGPAPVTAAPAESRQPFWVTGIAIPSDIILFIFSLLSTGIAFAERALRSWQQRGQPAAASLGGTGDVPKGRVVHYKTGDPIVGVEVLVYGSDGKLRATERTNSRGEFSTLFPAGEYTLGVQAAGFAFAQISSSLLKPENGIMYSGGKLTVPPGGKPITIVIPMKPTGVEVSSSKVQLLHLWQTIQRLTRLLSWPIFLAGALLNTLLIFVAPSFGLLVVEFLYVILVILKVALEVRVRPAYGLVRDAITHIPLDLAVVRLYESGTNRLIMTRVANNQGKFFALPPQGKYTITITKPGYGVFSKDNVEIASDQDSTLQLTADLMPVAPTSGLQQARAALL